MRFVSKGEEFAVATAVAIGSEVIGRAVREEGEDAAHLLRPIAVGGKEAACEPAVDNLYLSA
jgi:hypothetical protein